MKKAGIIIGLVFVIVAVSIFGIAQVISNKSTKSTKTNEEIVVEESSKNVNKSPVVVVETQTPLSNSTQSPTSNSKVEDKKKTSVIEIDNISNQGKEYEEIVVISSKKLLLIDEAVGEKEGKSLAFVFNVMTDSNRVLKLFVTETVYEQFKVGDKLKVNYKIITNDVGTEFPLIKRVTTTD